MTPEQIEEILVATSLGWWEYQASSDTVSTNPAWLKTLGYADLFASWDRERWLSIIHPDDRASILHKLSNTAIDSFETEVRMLNNHGDYIWFSSRMKIAERDVHGLPLRILGINVDIHERKRIEELEREVTRKTELIQGIMRISFSSTSVYDFLNQKIIHSQWRILRSFGYDEGEFENVSNHFFQKILHPEDAWIIEKHIEKIRQSKKEQVVECIFRLRDKSGSYHWVALRDSVLRWDKNGDICQLVGTIVDVTRYKAIKQQLDDNLAMLDSLSYRNSHELRAPVATILGLVTLIRHELQTEGSIQELVDILETTIVKMDNVIRDFGKALS
ncbi:MAG TPA: PAS domain-containing protein [Ohtaekwangia sp.]|uniref:PAS domain-containing protein n=1 Tax=Ohtaekwangia sp. TaxID=2066019 RepID=UPI002F9279DA